MKQVRHIDPKAKIDPTDGIGEIKLGMNCFYLRDLIDSNFQDKRGVYSADFDQNQWNSKLWSPFFQNLDIKYQDHLTITVNLFNGTVSHLTVKKGFKGKVYGIVGIGDTLLTFYKKYQKNFSEFEDDQFFFWFNERFGLSIYIGNGNEFEDFADDDLFSEYLKKPIQKITIFDNEQRLGIRQDLPQT